MLTVAGTLLLVVISSVPRKQRLTTRKEDASAPTVSVEAPINAKEGRDIATVDIPGAFMQADMDEIVHVRWEGAMTDLLVKMDPKLYRKYIINENGKPKFYVELKKALLHLRNMAVTRMLLKSRSSFGPRPKNNQATTPAFEGSNLLL